MLGSLDLQGALDPDGVEQGLQIKAGGVGDVDDLIRWRRRHVNTRAVIGDQEELQDLHVLCGFQGHHEAGNTALDIGHFRHHPTGHDLIRQQGRAVALVHDFWHILEQREVLRGHQLQPVDFTELGGNRQRRQTKQPHEQRAPNTANGHHHEPLPVHPGTANPAILHRTRGAQHD